MVNEGLGTKAKYTELPKSLGWYYKDLLKYLVVPILGMMIVLVVLWFFKDQFYIVFKMDTYLVWHNIFEFGSVITSFAIFLLSIYSYEHLGNRRELFLGVSFLIVGAVDFMHALSFPGMPAFVSQNSTGKAINYWIVARLSQAVALACSSFIPTRYKKPRFMRAALMIGALSFIGLTFYAVTYLPDQIPTMFVPDKGLTPTKIWLEYTVIFLALVAIGKHAITYRQSRGRESRILLTGLTFFVFSELSLTLYASAFDTYNLLGHIFKVGTMVSIFLALYASSVQKPFIERKRAEEALKEVQERLIRREKLAVIGQMAGGIGHELRNPLGVISNAVYYLQAILSDADEITREYLYLISSEVANGNKIINDLLDFSRIKTPTREETDISELITKVLERQVPPEGVKVSTAIPDDTPAVPVDPAQISQVLVNMVVNAYQAMPEGGELTISTHAIQTSEVSENPPRSEGVAISVTDTGCGISKENMKKLFEPLFTTKERGIGLGLAVSKNLVEANGGSIEIESDGVPGEGSTFTVRLPVTNSVDSSQ